MSAEEDRVLALAAQVSDGERVDWDAAERSAADERERAMVRRLRVVSSLAELHRSEQSEESESDVDVTATSLPPTRERIGDSAIAPIRTIGRWGRLDLVENLGEGAFGQVFLAWDPRLERHTALKLLTPRPGHPEARAAAIREGRLLAKVSHPNVVTVHGAEEHDGRVGIWMELIRGRTLSDLLGEQGSMSDREAAMIGVDLCRALAAVHRAGLVHRDVKAQNVMRAEGGRIVLMDFSAGGEPAREDHSGRIVSGTPLYMAPEIFRGERATTASDLYSLGVLLYHLVTGSFPIEAPTFRELHDKHERRDARLLRDARPDLSEAFVRIVERALAADPAERFPTAGHMEQALQLALGRPSAPAVPAEDRAAPHGVRARRLAFLAAAAATVAVAIGIWSMWPRQAGPPANAETGAPLLVVEQAPARTAAPAGSQVPPPTAASTGSELPARTLPFPGPPAAPVPGPPNSGAATAVPAGSYSVEAALYRVRDHGRAERLEPGARLAIGDELHLEFQASKPLHVYVVNEDDRGRAFVLFPLPSLDLKNPLPPGRKNRIPGTTREGKDLSWQVDTAGGREHLLILASAERLTEFEAEMAYLERPSTSEEPSLAVGLSDAAVTRLRGIGAMITASPSPAGKSSADRVFQMAGALASRSEVVSGVWLRQIELENPAP